MFPYWLLFSCFALGCFVGGFRTGPKDPFDSFGFRLAFLLLFAMLAFRWGTGFDWGRYIALFERMDSRSFIDVIQMRDPGYALLNWAVRHLDGGFWVVTLLGAVPFVFGLYHFSKAQPEPWIAAMVAIPYLVIVVAMGYIRQGIAIGFLLGGLAGLLQGKPYWRFIVATFLASLFHSTAVIAIPLTVMGLHRDRMTQLVAAPAVAYLLYTFAFQSQFDRFVANYVRYAMVSEGAGIRMAMCAVPAVLFLFYRNRLAFSDDERALWRNFSLASIALAVLFLLSTASTAVDRIALYLLPLQLAVFARLPLLINSRVGGRVLVIALFAAVQFVWLNYAQTARGWIPYRLTIPFSA